MKVIAEGVENRQQKDMIAALGCDLIQGYHYSRPLPAEAFEAFAREWSERHPAGGLSTSP